METKLVDYDALFEDVQTTFENGDKPGLSTGMEWLDKNYRVEQGEVCVITGFPGSGKSEFMDYLSVCLSKLYGFKYAYFSPETKPAHYHVRRIIQKFYDKSFFKRDNVDPGYRVPQLEHSELIEGMQFYKDHYSLIDSGSNVTIEDIFKVVLKVQAEKGINGFVIDPWNRLESSRPSGVSETDFISKTLDKISTFCEKHVISCWIVAHPSKPPTNTKGGYTPAISLYAVSGSAHWYNKIDNGIWIRRDTIKGTVIADILKIKKQDNGEIGEVEMKFNPYTGTYSEAPYL